MCTRDLGPFRAAQDLEDVVRADNQHHHRHVDQRVESPVDTRGLRAGAGVEAHVAFQNRHSSPRDHQTYEADDEQDYNQEQVQKHTAPPPGRKPLPSIPRIAVPIPPNLSPLRGGRRIRRAARMRPRIRPRRVPQGVLAGFPLQQAGVRPLGLMHMGDVHGAHALVAPIPLPPRHGLGRLAADEVYHVVRDEGAVAGEGRVAVLLAELLRRLPGGAAEQLGGARGEDGQCVGGDALERPVHGEALAPAP